MSVRKQYICLPQCTIKYVYMYSVQAYYPQRLAVRLLQMFEDNMRSDVIWTRRYLMTRLSGTSLSIKEGGGTEQVFLLDKKRCKVCWH